MGQLNHSAVAETTTAPPVSRSWFYNPDLAPVVAGQRNWNTYNYAALWMVMSAQIPTYMLASGMLAGGMSWKQAIFTIFLGNAIVLVPILLTAHAGARYAIPFPVFARSSFGLLGANIPVFLRAVVACVGFAIQTWLGGQAINALLASVVAGWGDYWLGEPLCFGLFWLLNLYIIVRGMETIRWLQAVSAPLLLLSGLVLLAWARGKAAGFGPMFLPPAKFHSFSEFFSFFLPSLSAVVAFWAALVLNIADFSRYARNQRAQLLGQTLALPTTMTLYAFIGVAVTSASIVIFGAALWDPVAVVNQSGHAVAVLVALGALLLASLNANVAVNLVAAANAFSSFWPRRVSFRLGGVLACVIGLLMQPWQWPTNYGKHIFSWLVGCASFLGAIAGVLIADYFILRKKTIVVEDLCQRGSFYEFTHGFNLRALAAVVAGVGLALAGLVVAPLRFLYACGWFVGFATAFVVYLLLMRKRP